MSKSSATNATTVAYEGAIFEILPIGGIARYFRDILDRLPNSVASTVIAPVEHVVETRNRDTDFYSVRTKAPFRFLRSQFRKRQHQAINNYLTPSNCDLVHWTYYTGLCRQPIRNLSVPSVVTVYDFIHESFPSLDPSGRHSAWKQEAIRIADHICCISESTLEKLCHYHPEASKKASVTLLGNSFATVAAASIPGVLESRPFLLFVGRRDSYKDFATVWQAWKTAKQKSPELTLVVVGSKFKKRERKEYGDALDNGSLIHLGNVDDRVLKSLYQECLAFVFPSREEGFGLPAVEAMESSAPVVAANCDALREVLGSAGYLFDPGNANELAELMSLASNHALPDLTSNLQIGRNRAAELTWEKTVDSTVQRYSELVGKDVQIAA